jgi:3',5'-cyclic AMP phosphodiesterase CpdA
MYRIAHFSDLHLIDFNDDWEFALDTIRGAVEEDGADHIVISGDVIDAALMVVLRYFIIQLREWGLTAPEALSVTPGNHDIFPCSLSRLTQVFAPGRNSGLLKTPTDNWLEFCEITAPRGKKKARARANALRLLPDEPYPLGKRLTEHVAVAAMDTTRNGVYNPLAWATGELPLDHVDAVGEFFEENADAQHRVVVMHHYPWREDARSGPIQFDMKEPAPEEAVEQLKEIGATLILCGHLHDDEAVDLGDGLIGTRSTGLGKYALVDLLDNGRVRITRKEVMHARNNARTA